MNITVETKNRTVSISEPSDDIDVFGMYDLFKDLCLAMGYHPDSVKDAIVTAAEEYSDTSDI